MPISLDQDGFETVQKVLVGLRTCCSRIKIGLIAT